MNIAFVNVCAQLHVHVCRQRAGTCTPVNLRVPVWVVTHARAPDCPCDHSEERATLKS